MQPSLSDGLLWYIVFLYSTTCHEAAHAWAALKLGDDTAARGGQVSLNPWPHLKREPLGMAVVPIISFVAGGWLFGWASAPFDPEWARRFPKRAGLMAVAGPAANLGLLLVAGILIRFGLEWQVFAAPYWTSANHIVLAPRGGLLEFAAHFLSVAFALNLLLLAFNLLPVPPLDGSSLPLLVLPERFASTFYRVMRSPYIRLIGLLIVFRTSGTWFPPLFGKVISLFYIGIAPS